MTITREELADLQLAVRVGRSTISYNQRFGPLVPLDGGDVERLCDAVDRLLAERAELVRVLTEEAQGGVGWWEFHAPGKVTTHIVYVYEDGSWYFPEGLDVVDPTWFTLAAASGKTWRLIRAGAALALLDPEGAADA